MSLIAGLLLALFSALALNASYFGQHAATKDLEQLSLRRPLRGLVQLFAHPGWLGAYLGGWVGWGAYVAALRLAPLSLVQSVSAGGVSLLVLFARRTSGRQRKRERNGAILASAGLVCVIASLRPGEHSRSVSFHTIGLLIVVGLVVAALLLAIFRRRPAIGLSLAAGLCYGVGDVATKGAVSGTVLLVPIFLVCHVLGFIATQLAYQRGSLIESAGLSSLLTNAIPLAAGIWLFGEAPPNGLLGALRIFGFVAALCGAALITGQHSTSEALRPVAE